MRNKILYTLSLVTCLAGTALSETPRWISDAMISPQGDKIAFSYKGELFTIGLEGGKAVRLTANPAYDSKPVWTPDGKKIAFLSTRENSDDIFLISSEGGTPSRLTFTSTDETPLAFLNDSLLLFNSQGLPGRETIRAPFMTQVYCIDINQSHPRQKLFLSMPVAAASVNSKGDILFQDRKGFEDELRKHEHSSGTSDILLMEGDTFRKLTEFNGQDQSPAWGHGDIFYYLGENDGTMNVYEASVSGNSSKKLTSFEKHPVRSLSASHRGVLAFIWDGELYSLVPGDKPKKINIEINEDLYDTDEIKRFITSGASNGAVNDKGSEVAFIARGEVYVTDAKYKTTKRITENPWQERTVSFSPDGRSLVFDSDVNGNWQLFIAKIKNPDEKSFAYATEIEIEPLYDCGTSAMQPVYSPDGKKVAFLEDRTEVKVIDIDTKNVTTALPGKYNYSYNDGDIPLEWSPDSKWLLTTYLGEGGWNNMDIAAVKADGSQIVNLTESGYVQGNPKWALNGKAVTFATNYYGMKSHGSWGNQDDVMLMVLDPEAWEEFNFTEEESELNKKDEEEKEENSSSDNKNDKKGKKQEKNASDKADKKKEFNPDFANRRYRTKRLTENSSSLLDYYLNADGSKLYYVSESPDGDFNIYVTDLKKDETSVLFKDMPAMFLPPTEGESVFLFSREGFAKVNLEQADIKPVEYEALYDRKPSQEREYIFDHVSHQTKDKFYDVNMHGVDWDYYTDYYRQFLPYINNNRDFATLLSEFLGELNASHTGARYKMTKNGLSSSYLGAFFDDTYIGDGLLITEVLPDGPLALGAEPIIAGDIIITIDGEKILPNEDYNRMLEGKEGKKVRIGVKKKNGQETVKYIRPVSFAQQNEMAYKRWVENNERYVDSISDGKIGYVHVKGMDGESFNTIYDRLLGKYRNCDAVVVDTRYNGGGWLHNDLAILLSGQKYVTFSPRGREIGIEPFSQWTKPSVMLVNESNYSDAHGSPFTYQTLGIGEVVGAPVPGTMTAVWWEYQIDPTIVFGIPQVTNKANDGTVLENTQLNPDIIIYNDPADIEKGKDVQLEGAVKHLLSKNK